jgi:TP901 family phage tail tape measure protein
MTTQTTDLELRIRTALENAEKLVGFTGSVEDLQNVAGTAAAAAQELDGALGELAKLQEQIAQQKELQGRLAETSAELTKARDLQRQLSAEVVASLGPTQKQIAEQTAAGNSVAKLEARQASLRDRQRELTQQVIAADQPSEKLIAQHDRTTRKLEALDRALLTAKNRLSDANAAVAAGAEPSDKLARKHEEATRTAEALSAQEQHLRQQLDATSGALRESGVDVANLDKASQHITQTFDEVGRKTRAFADAAAKLNFVPKEQIEREATALRQAYETLRSSGTLTQKELATANLRMQEGLAELQRQTNGWKESLVKARYELATSVAVLTPIAAAIKQAVDFESAWAGVRKVVDGTDEQFAHLTDRVRDLSRELPISAEGLAEIAAFGGQLGVPIEKLDQFVTLAAKMSVAFDVTEQAAGEAAAKLTNVFDLPLEKVESLGDAINVLGNTTAAKESQILDFLVRVGGSAKTFGLTAEATAALGAEFISLGRKPEVASNAVNKLLATLQTANVQSPKARAALDDIGLSAEALAEKIRKNPQAALEEFLVTLEQLDNQSRAEAIAQILGVEYSDDISLLVNGLNGYREALQRVGDQQQVNGALQKEFDKQNETTRNQYRLLRNEIGNIVRDLGTALLPTVKAGVAVGREVIEVIGDLVQLAPGLTAFVGTVASVGLALNGLKVFGAAARVGLASVLDVARALPGQLTATAAAGDAVAASQTRIATTAGLAQRGMSLLAGVARAAPYLLLATEVVALARAHAEYQEAAENARAAEEKNQKALRDGIDAARTRAAEYSAQAAQTRVALESIAGGIESLSAAQRTHYAGLLSGSEQYLQAQISIGVREQELYGKTAINLAAVGQQLRDVRAAQQQLADAQAAIKPLTADDIAPGAADVAKRFADIREEIEKTSAESLIELRDQASTALETARTKLAELETQFGPLKGASAEFIAHFVPGLATARNTVEQLSGTVDTLRNEALRRLGVDAGEVLAAFKLLVSDPQADPKLLQAAFEGLLQKLDSPQELEALRLSLAKVQQQGFDTAGAIGAIDTAIKQLPTAQAAATTAATDLSGVYKKVGADGAKSFSDVGIAAEKMGDQAADSAGAVSTVNMELSEGNLALVDQFNQRIQKEKDAAKASRESSKEVQKDAKDTADAAEQAAQSVGGVGAALAAFYDGLIQRLGALSTEAVQAFVNPSGQMTDAAQRLRDSAAAAGDQIARIAEYNNLYATNDIADWMDETAIRALQVEKSFYAQAASLQALTDQYQRGQLTAQQFVDASERSRVSTNLLGQEQMRPLRDALDDANRRLQSLRDNAEDTLSSLQDELDQLQGKQDEIEKRRREKQKADIQTQLAAANAAGDKTAAADLQQALALLDQITKTQAQAASTSPSASAPVTTAPSSTGVQTSRYIEIRWTIPGIGSANGYYVQTDAERLEAMFEELARQLGISVTVN